MRTRYTVLCSCLLIFLLAASSNFSDSPFTKVGVCPAARHSVETLPLVTGHRPGDCRRHLPRKKTSPGSPSTWPRPGRRTEEDGGDRCGWGGGGSHAPISHLTTITRFAGTELRVTIKEIFRCRIPAEESAPSSTTQSPRILHTCARSGFADAHANVHKSTWAAEVFHNQSHNFIKIKLTVQHLLGLTTDPTARRAQKFGRKGGLGKTISAAAARSRCPVCKYGYEERRCGRGRTER